MTGHSVYDDFRPVGDYEPGDKVDWYGHTWVVTRRRDAFTGYPVVLLTRVGDGAQRQVTASLRMRRAEP